jgi:hypothetical protein
MQTRLVLPLMFAGALVTACTAVVAGGLSESNDLPVHEGGTSSSSGGSEDECALVPDGSQNTCSTCITNNCKSDIEYACNRGKQEKGWFSSLQSCAKSPFVNYGGSFYSCKSYAFDGGRIPSGDDAEKKRDSEICVRDKCLQGPTPACKLCPVKTEKTGTSEYANLADDPCGSCFNECQADVVECCDSEAIAELEPCAFTADKDNLTVCKLLTGYPDAGRPDGRPDPTERGAYKLYCQYKLRDCFNQHCKEKAACKN